MSEPALQSNLKFSILTEASGKKFENATYQQSNFSTRTHDSLYFQNSKQNTKEMPPDRADANGFGPT